MLRNHRKLANLKYMEVQACNSGKYKKLANPGGEPLSKERGAGGRFSAAGSNWL